MTCRDLIDFLMDYLDGDLQDAARREFDDHLRRCPACRTYLQSYRETVKLGTLASASDEEVPPDVPEELIQAILAARRSSG